MRGRRRGRNRPSPPSPPSRRIRAGGRVRRPGDRQSTRFRPIVADSLKTIRVIPTGAEPLSRPLPILQVGSRRQPPFRGDAPRLPSVALTTPPTLLLQQAQMSVPPKHRRGWPRRWASRRSALRLRVWHRRPPGSLEPHPLRRTSPSTRRLDQPIRRPPQPIRLRRRSHRGRSPPSRPLPAASHRPLRATHCPGSLPWPTRRVAWARPPPRSTSGPPWPSSATGCWSSTSTPRATPPPGSGIDARNFELSMYDVIMRDSLARGLHRADQREEPLRGPGHHRPGRRRDRAGARLQPGAQAQAGHRVGDRRLRLRPDRLPPVARA